MKINFKILKKDEKGSISVLVLFTILMMLAILMGVFYAVMTKQKAQLKSDMRIQQVYDQDINAIYDEQVEKIIQSPLKPGDTSKKTEKNNYKDKNGDMATIPEGFTISDVIEEDGEGNITNDETTIENGLVVIDKNDNEWVWIPVDDVTEMYDEDSTGWELISEVATTNTKYKSKSLPYTVNDVEIGIGRTIKRTTPDSTSGDNTSGYYREPGILNGENYDANATNLEKAGFTTVNQMAKALVDDYKNMINSIRNYGGFYVGRYELGTTSETALTASTVDKGTPQVQKGSYVMNYTNWYDLYSYCKTFATTDTQSRMIWGNQWDEICKFVRDHGDKIEDLSNSKTYGNYSNSSGDAATNSGTANFNGTTGRNEYWKTNNIYDLAGNCNDWTQEVYHYNSRSARGGGCNGNGYNSINSSNVPDPCEENNQYLTTRPTLYIKLGI